MPSRHHQTNALLHLYPIIHHYPQIVCLPFPTLFTMPWKLKVQSSCFQHRAGPTSKTSEDPHAHFGLLSRVDGKKHLMKTFDFLLKTPVCDYIHLEAHDVSGGI